MDSTIPKIKNDDLHFLREVEKLIDANIDGNMPLLLLLLEKPIQDENVRNIDKKWY